MPAGPSASSSFATGASSAKQAHNAYKQFLDSEPRTYVTTKTNEDREKTVYLATYPAMMKCFQNFDAGFFDLIIADESHRSIYNRYRDLFVYFDAMQVGLTATPRGNINHNTYLMFDCEDHNPTAHYSYKEAINDTPPYLVPFRVTKHTTKFMREGMSYAKMDPQQREEADEQVEDSESIDYSKEQVNQAVYNKDTDRKILRNLMENGIRVADGVHVGKSIIFARNHRHALQLQRPLRGAVSAIHAAQGGVLRRPLTTTLIAPSSSLTILRIARKTCTSPSPWICSTPALMSPRL